MTINSSVQAELENLQIQFGKQSMLTLDDYAELYRIPRHRASQHLRRRGIPAIKEGKSLYISMLDLAKYKADRKEGRPTGLTLATASYEDRMKSRRGFSKERVRL